MSDLIDFAMKNQLDPSAYPYKKYNNLYQNRKSKPMANIFIQSFQQIFKTNKISIEKKQNIYNITSQMPSFYQSNSLLTNAEYADSDYYIKIQNTLLSNGKPYTLSNKNMRIAAMHLILEFNLYFNDLVLMVDMHNGRVVFKNTIRAADIIMNEEFLYRAFSGTVKIFWKNKEKFMKLFENIYNDTKFLIKQPSNSDSTFIIGEKITKYLRISFIELDVSEVESERRRLLQRAQINERNAFENDKPIDMLNFRLNQSLALYQIVNEKYHKKFRVEDLLLSDQEIRQFSVFLTFPKPKIVNQSQNEFIFNDIIIKNPDNFSSIPFSATGGNSSLILGDIRFQYIMPVKSMPNKRMENRQTFTQKRLLIKFPKTQRTQKFIQHEIKVLSTLRATSCAYMIRYYRTQQNCPLKNKLMMEYNSYYVDLYTFIMKNKQTLSIYSKLHLLANIANGLRFLKKQGIVHMDLNPRNILVAPGLLTKIIDFGQAYYERVCGPNYTPGFTNPYGPPQTFSQNHFETKNDIFSFGMILFYLLFNHLPYQPTQKLKECYKNKTYNSKLFLALEHSQYIWQQGPMMFLISLFIRCKSVDTLNRPYPTWVRVLLRLLLGWGRNLFGKK